MLFSAKTQIGINWSAARVTPLRTDVFYIACSFIYASGQKTTKSETVNDLKAF